MATSLLALLDDIATVLDDVAVMTKVAARQGVSAADDVAAMTQMAAKKTAGVLGDDLALNAQQVTGVKADRELPVVWAVAKGSMVNKAILVPLALVISAFAAWAITPLLMLGGLFLCFEGVEKLMHSLGAHKADDKKHHDELVKAVADEKVDLVAFEKQKIKGAVRTDFCAPIGHRQVKGDYVESWQPQAMNAAALERARHALALAEDVAAGRLHFTPARCRFARTARRSIADRWHGDGAPGTVAPSSHPLSPPCP